MTDIWKALQSVEMLKVEKSVEMKVMQLDCQKGLRSGYYLAEMLEYCLVYSQVVDWAYLRVDTRDNCLAFGLVVMMV